MPPDAPGTADVHVSALIDHLFRHTAGQMVSTLVRVFGPENLQLAEDVVQDALIEALRRWPYSGIPAHPQAWLMQVAKHRAIDILRRMTMARERLLPLAEQDAAALTDLSLDDPLGDDQLAMIFMCCHPSLAAESQVALILKTVGGFSVSEIAHAFLASETAIAQRLVRAKRRLREDDVEFAIPADERLPARLATVLQAIYLLYNEGYAASSGVELLRLDVCAEAMRLTSLLAAHPHVARPEVHALFALLLFHASRFPTRADDEGNLLLLLEQDRTLWDQQAISAGLAHLERASQGDQVTAFHLQAGIAACHATAASYEATNWATILYYYDQLIRLQPSPVVALNRAVAISMVHGPHDALSSLAEIVDSDALQRYYLFSATLGELHRRLGDMEQAMQHFSRAYTLTANGAQKAFLARRIALCHEST